MAIYKTDNAAGIRPAPESDDVCLVSVRAEFSLSAALAAADVVQLAELPAGFVVTDFILDCDDLDAGATVTADLGVLDAAGAVSAAAADGGKWLTADTSLRAASVTRMSAQSVAVQQAILRMSKSDSPRKIGLNIVAGPTTASSGKIGLTLTYRAV